MSDARYAAIVGHQGEQPLYAADIFGWKFTSDLYGAFLRTKKDWEKSDMPKPYPKVKGIVRVPHKQWVCKD